MSDRESSEAYVTLATNDSYSVGALVLGESLRHTGTRRHLVVMITNQVTDQMRHQLRETFDALVVVDVLDSRDTTNLNLLSRPDLGMTFTKLHCWRLTQFNKCVFLDADTLVLHNIDELFDCEELAAAPDVGWPDCFNSGVFVFQPSHDTYTSLMNFSLTCGSFDGGDQGLLNQYFSDWSTQGRTRRLPFIYNTVAQAFYSYAPAYKQYGHSVKVIHFIGSVKPWNVGYNTATRSLEGGPYQATEFLNHWWNLFIDNVHHRLADPLKSAIGSGTSTSPSYQSEGGGASWGPGHYPQQQLDDGHRQYNWEKGQIDYMGVDSFDNIMRQLDTKILPVNKDPVSQSGVSAPKAAPTNRVKDGPPAAKSRVLQALENQFREGSEFRKSSTDLVLPVPPRKSVHRATVLLPPKVYKEQVIDKAAASAPKSAAQKSSGSAAGAPVSSAAGSKLTAAQLPAAAVQKPAATAAQPAAASAQLPAATAVQLPAAGFSQPAAIHKPAAPLSDAQLAAMTSSAPVAQPLGLSSPTGVQTSPVYEKKGSTGSPQAVLPQEQFSPTRGVVGGFHGGQGQIGSAHTPAFDNSSFGAYSSDQAFGSGSAPLAFSTPAAGGHSTSAPGLHASAGFSGQLPAKTSPASPPSAPFDPFSGQASFTSGSSSRTAFSAGDPFSTRGGVDPFADQGAKQVGPGVTVSGGIGGASRQTPPAAAGMEFEEPIAGHQQHQHKSKRAGNKKGKK